MSKSPDPLHTMREAGIQTTAHNFERHSKANYHGRLKAEGLDSSHLETLKIEKGVVKCGGK